MSQPDQPRYPVELSDRQANLHHRRYTAGAFIDTGPRIKRKEIDTQQPLGIFIAQGMSNYRNSRGLFNDQLMERNNWLAGKLREDEGCLVYSAVEREIGGVTIIAEPRVTADIDISQLEAADVIIAFPEDSHGVLLELGILMGFVLKEGVGKDLIIVAKSPLSVKIPHFLQGALDLFERKGVDASVTIIEDNFGTMESFREDIYPQIQRQLGIIKEKRHREDGK